MATVVAATTRSRLRFVGLDREARTEYLELRPAASTVVTTGTLACPGCDAPISPPAGRSGLADPLACGFCGHGGAVREFLSLAQPTRPAHVVLHARLP